MMMNTTTPTPSPRQLMTGQACPPIWKNPATRCDRKYVVDQSELSVMLLAALKTFLFNKNKDFSCSTRGSLRKHTNTNQMEFGASDLRYNSKQSFERNWSRQSVTFRPVVWAEAKLLEHTLCLCPKLLYHTTTRYAAHPPKRDVCVLKLHYQT